jgi:hypothetical protein
MLSSLAILKTLLEGVCFAAGRPEWRMFVWVTFRSSDGILTLRCFLGTVNWVARPLFMAPFTPRRVCASLPTTYKGVS